jgi:hypothetical protein
VLLRRRDETFSLPFFAAARVHVVDRVKSPSPAAPPASFTLAVN